MSFFKKLFSGAAPQTATVHPWGVELVVGPNQTLLEAALAAKLPFPHNCTVGTCGSCRCRLVAGKVSAITDFGYTLSAAELAAGYILACQASVKSAITVEVEHASAHLPVAEAFTGKVLAQEQLTHDILGVTVALDRPMTYVAGQYANVTLAGLAARSYSFATAPARGGRQDITFYIRKVPGGALTEKLFGGAFAGAEISVAGPYGNFYLRDGAGPILCIAGGSGLAPLLSVLQDARKNRLRRPCTLLFGARTQADLYGLDQIAEIKESWLETFAFQPVLSHEPADSAWTGARGLVTATLAEAFAESTQAYLCGPPPMVDAAIAALTERGISPTSIHYDKFTDASHTTR